MIVRENYSLKGNKCRHFDLTIYNNGHINPAFGPKASDFYGPAQSIVPREQ